MGGRIIAIGDVHGCVRELEALIHKLALRERDALVFMGDLINRGPDSAAVLRLVRSLPNTRAILGNHELRLREYRRTGDGSHLKKHDWKTMAALSEADWDFIMGMAPFIEYAHLQTVLVHGGFLPGKPWQQQPLSVTTRIQVIADGLPAKRAERPDGTPWAALWEGPPFVIYAHAPQREVQVYPWALGIDTGCVLGGALTACILPERTLVQVPAFEKYHGKALD